MSLTLYFIENDGTPKVHYTQRFHKVLPTTLWSGWAHKTEKGSLRGTTPCLAAMLCQTLEVEGVTSEPTAQQVFTRIILSKRKSWDQLHRNKSWLNTHILTSTIKCKLTNFKCLPNFQVLKKKIIYVLLKRTLSTVFSWTESKVLMIAECPAWFLTVQRM